MKQEYVIGVDGGGTKTSAVLADLKGKILKMAEAGPSSPRNIEMSLAAQNIAKAINKVLKKGKILSTFIGLAAIEEQPRLKTKIKKQILKQKGISPIFKGKLKMGSDQLAAFRSGTDQKNGLLLIAGTGCVAHGWRKDKEAHASGWGWLNDEGSAFWVGQRAFQAALKEMDKRGTKTLITELVFKRLKVKDIEGILEKVYSNPLEIVPIFSILVDQASKKGDGLAQRIMEEAGKELALAATRVIKELGLAEISFPLVLVGSMFKSKIVLKTVKKEVRKLAPRTKFIQPRGEPVIGAVKLALENLKR